MPIYLLLAMQAAGMVTDYLGNMEQQRIAGMGADLQRAGIDLNIEQTRLETQDASLQALKKLRQNLGTQAAVFAARGTRTDAGSAVSIMQESLGNFNSDERMRRMNLLNRETALRGEGLISRLNQSGENTKMWSTFASRNANLIPTNAAGYGKLGEGFGLTSSGA